MGIVYHTSNIKAIKIDYTRFKKEHLVEIDELLKDATENNPDLRPDIHEFTKKLLLWREIADDFDKSQNSDWKFLTKQLFGKNVPGYNK